MTQTTCIRAAKPDDCPALLSLMQALAEFEGYADQFCVTTADLLHRGFPPSGEAEFQVVVAENNDAIIGMLVYYFIPFTFDLRPTLFIKELYVDASSRSQGVGDLLFNAVVKIAKQTNCGRIKWDVLSSNDGAQRFYLRQGAQHDAKWQGYILKTD